MMRSIGVTNKEKKIIFCAVLKKPKIAVLFQYGNFDEWLMNEACHSNTFHIYNKKKESRSENKGQDSTIVGWLQICTRDHAWKQTVGN